MLPSTVMALRASVAAALALFVSRWITLQRPYWTILVAVVLMNPTLGATYQRGLERLAMTAGGCAAGAVLHWLSQDSPDLESLLMLVSIFLAVFFRLNRGLGSYAWMMFFITVYVVFLFSLMNRWTAEILLVRLIDTAVGCVLALIAAWIVPPASASGQLRRGLDALTENCRSELNAALHPSMARKESPHTKLLRQLQQLRSQGRESTYEHGLSRKAITARRRLLAQAEFRVLHTLGFVDAAEQIGPAARDCFEQNFQPLIARVNFSHHGRASTKRVTELYNRLELTPDDTVWAIPAVHHLVSLGMSPVPDESAAPQN